MGARGFIAPRHEPGSRIGPADEVIHANFRVLQGIWPQGHEIDEEEIRAQAGRESFRRRRQRPWHGTKEEEEALN